MGIDLQHSWIRCWRGIGARDDGGPLREALLARYGEAHRKYHTLQHLGEVLAQFDAVQGLAIHPAEVEVALWFHDAVYDLKRSDNEERSADWAQAAALESGAAAEAGGRIHQLVMATRHAQAPVGADAQLLVDIDLSILGAGRERFAEYELQIREEYGHVPRWLFKRKRSAVLRAFLARPRLFSTPHFHAALEAAARTNLQAALEGQGAA
jgi:predicted metal-dependent HD superfamily phosphohydrolase